MRGIAAAQRFPPWGEVREHERVPLLLSSVGDSGRSCATALEQCARLGIGINRRDAENAENGGV